MGAWKSDDCPGRCMGGGTETKILGTPFIYQTLLHGGWEDEFGKPLLYNYNLWLDLCDYIS